MIGIEHSVFKWVIKLYMELVIIEPITMAALYQLMCCCETWHSLKLVTPELRCFEVLMVIPEAHCTVVPHAIPEAYFLLTTQVAGALCSKASSCPSIIGANVSDSDSFYDDTV